MKTNKKILTISLIFLTFLTITFGQGSSKTLKRFAIVVGANNGGSERVQLQYAIKDAESVAKVLQNIGGIESTDCLLLCEPNKAQLLNAFKKIQSSLKNDREKYLVARNPELQISFIDLEKVNERTNEDHYLICSHKDPDKLGESHQQMARTLATIRLRPGVPCRA